MDGEFVEFEVADGAGALVGSEDAFGFEIGDGGVVDVGAGNEDVLAVGAGGLGEHIAPAVEGGVADFAPVHGDEDDGLLAAGEHDAGGEEGVSDGFGEP